MADVVKLNHAEIQAYLDGGHGVAALLTQKAAPVLAAAQATAPVDTGAYRNSIHIEIAHTDRMVVRVAASDYKAGILEAEFGVLGRALGQARK